MSLTAMACHGRYASGAAGPAGKLASLRGAVLGQFTQNFKREDAETDDPRYSVEGVLRQYFEPLGIPVLMNFPVGHHPMNATLPLGGQVEVDARRCQLRVLPAAADSMSGSGGEMRY